MAKERSELEALLADKAILPTQQRLEIAEVMLERDQHLSADQVLDRLRERGSRVSKATVYNSLGLFAEKGLLRQVIVDPARTFYDSNTRPHHHFYNEDSGSLTDFSPDAVSVNGLPELPDGTRACGVDVVVRLRNEAD